MSFLSPLSLVMGGIKKRHYSLGIPCLGCLKAAARRWKVGFGQTNPSETITCCSTMALHHYPEQKAVGLQRR
jgi:hypothetical protein